ncbi:MAG: DUF3943 domain-containing protein [Woeseiaceae bacterium]
MSGWAVRVIRSVDLPGRYLAAVAAGVLAGPAASGQSADPVEITVRLPGTKARTFAEYCRDPGAGMTLPSTTGCEGSGVPDRRGRRSDTLHFFAYQAAAIAILYSMPESTTGWTTESKENYSLGRWWDNAREPHLDSDDFFWNYVTHPYWGAAYFVRSRERGYGELESFWYAAAISAAYEFGAEALFEKPSIQDLVVTPVGGWLVGSYFMGVRDDIRARYDGGATLPFRHRFVLTMTDPLGAINRTVDRWFGLDQRFNLQPVVYRRRVTNSVNGDAPTRSEQVYGIVFTYVW